MHDATETCAVVLVYYRHLEAIHRCPDYQGILIIWVNLYVKAPFVTITKYVDYAGALIFKCSINRFHFCYTVSIHRMK